MRVSGPGHREDGLRAVRDIRLRRGLSQADLSAKTGVAEYTISEIEGGKRTPRPSTLRKLAQGLDVDVGDFYEEPQHPLSEAPPELQPSLNGELKEQRRLQLLHGLRALIRRLELRWEEDEPQSAREITVVLDIMEALLNESVIGQGRIRIPDEFLEIAFIRNSLENLNNIADSIQKDERRRALLRVIEEERSA
jgi:transcriptional regulator with XRE-family HTH domain